MTTPSPFRRALRGIHQFHLRYRWAFLLIVTALTMIALFGVAELGKAIYALGLEQVLLRAGAWASAAGEDSA